ncbi:MAG TPA: hypothetical protein PLA68_05505 [Panacibacter sp.]|nr:hypothetical protein [Panacibacter sp.]
MSKQNKLFRKYIFSALLLFILFIQNLFAQKQVTVGIVAYGNPTYKIAAKYDAESGEGKVWYDYNRMVFTNDGKTLLINNPVLQTYDYWDIENNRMYKSIAVSNAEKSRSGREAIAAFLPKQSFVFEANSGIVSLINADNKIMLQPDGFFEIKDTLEHTVVKGNLPFLKLPKKAKFLLRFCKFKYYAPANTLYIMYFSHFTGGDHTITLYSVNMVTGAVTEHLSEIVAGWQTMEQFDSKKDEGYFLTGDFIGNYFISYRTANNRMPIEEMGYSAFSLATQKKVGSFYYHKLTELWEWPLGLTSSGNVGYRFSGSQLQGQKVALSIDTINSYTSGKLILDLGKSTHSSYNSLVPSMIMDDEGKQIAFPVFFKTDSLGDFVSINIINTNPYPYNFTTSLMGAYNTKPLFSGYYDLEKLTVKTEKQELLERQARLTTEIDSLYKLYKKWLDEKKISTLLTNDSWTREDLRYDFKYVKAVTQTGKLGSMSISNDMVFKNIPGNKDVKMTINSSMAIDGQLFVIESTEYSKYISAANIGSLSIFFDNSRKPEIWDSHDAPFDVWDEYRWDADIYRHTFDTDGFEIIQNGALVVLKFITRYNETLYVAPNSINKLMKELNVVKSQINKLL